MDYQKLYKSLKNIQKTCKKCPECKGCPFYVEPTGCEIAGKVPGDWKIIPPPVVKLME